VFLEVDLSAKARWETVQSRVPVFRVNGEKLIPARLLPSAGHRRQRSL